MREAVHVGLSIDFHEILHHRGGGGRTSPPHARPDLVSRRLVVVDGENVRLHASANAVGIVAYAAYDRRLVDYLRALTVMSYGTFLDAGLHVS